MLTLSETPEELLLAISKALASVRELRARHWLVLSGRGRSEFVLQQWARQSGIASHTQEVQLRELLDQASAGVHKRFDFESLRLAVAQALPALRGEKNFPLPPAIPTTPITSAILEWSTLLAKAIDEALISRKIGEHWESDSFFEVLTKQECVATALERHVCLATNQQFELAATQWMSSWTEKGGMPHLWIQLDSGLPEQQFQRLSHLIKLVNHFHPDRLHLFALSPSREYWGEAKLRGKLTVEPQTDPDLHPGGLLWAFGRNSQDLHRQLAGTFLAEGEGGIFVDSAPTPNTLLGNLQLSCRRSQSLEESELQALNPADSSLTIHSSRSTLRELEICRDRILQARIEIPDLRYEEIMILLASPKRQAPYVEAALRLEHSEQRTLPHRMLGLGQAVRSPLAEGVLLLLEKIRGRLGLDDLQSLMENPLIGAHFGFTVSEESGQDLISWLRDAQFRWGLDTSHREEFQPMDNGSERRWNLFWALQRLGLGAIVAPSERDSILSLPGQSHSTAPLERTSGLGLKSLAQLAKFAVALKKAKSTWKTDTNKSIKDWNTDLLSLVTEFLSITDPSVGVHYAKLETTILPGLLRACENIEVELTADAYIRLIEEKLNAITDSGVKGIGGICIADLRQYAGVPARMILVVGLDDGVFPGRDDRPQWHPLNQSRRTGDPSIRNADRHALLLALLSCKERLVLTYQGGTDTDSTERPPSTALTDLFLTIDRSVKTTNSLRNKTSEEIAPHKQVLFTHPLNGFSPKAFNPAHPSSARGMLLSDFHSAQTLCSRNGLHEYQGLWHSSIPHQQTPPESGVRIEDLRLLFTEPSRLFLRQTGIRLPDEEDQVEGHDLIKPDSLHKWSLSDQILSAHIEGMDTRSLIERWTASGQLPRGAIGIQLCAQISRDLPSLPHYPLSASDRLRVSPRLMLSDGKTPPHQILLEGNLKSGWYRAPTASRADFFTASSKTPKHLLAFYLDALFQASYPLSETNIQHLAAATAHFKKGITVELSLPDPTQARLLLTDLLPLLELAKQIPLPFWPESAQAMTKVAGTRSEHDPNIVQKVLETGFHRWLNGSGNTLTSAPPECESPATRSAFRGCLNPFQWTPNLPELAWLPDQGLPLAWRINRFLSQWMKAGNLPPLV